jgi:putative ABC transport system substrate-binding protein
MRLIGLVLALGLTLAPLKGEAQQPNKLPQIGYLVLAPLVDPPSAERAAFLDGLRRLGYIAGRNIIIEYRSAAWSRELLSSLAAELVELRVDLILAAGPQATQAAREATQKIPIVMIAGGPMESGLVASLARPGGNVTGFSTNMPELGGKRLELLHEVVPRVSRVSVIWNPGNPAATSEWKATQTAARTLGMKLESVEVRGAEEFRAVLSKMSQHRPPAVVMIDDTLTTTYREIFAEFALKTRLPAIMASRAFAESGGLLSYGTTTSDLFRRAAGQVDRILKGAKPADLPVEQPTKFELVINLKTAKALSLTIPQSILVRADEVIQ